MQLIAASPVAGMSVPPTPVARVFHIMQQIPAGPKKAQTTEVIILLSGLEGMMRQ